MSIKTNISKVRLSLWLALIVALLLPAMTACSDTPENDPIPELPDQGSQDADTIPEEPKQLSPDATEIPENFFENRTAQLPLPPTVRTIADYAFYGCQNDHIVVPENVDSIGTFAFEKGLIYHSNRVPHMHPPVYRPKQPEGKLQYIYIPESVTKCGFGCFVGMAKENWYSYDYCSRYYDDFIDNPRIVIESTEPPLELFTQGMAINFAYLTQHDDQKTPKYDIYVKESAIEKISSGLWNSLDSEIQNSTNPEWYMNYPHIVNLKTNLRFIPYKPLDVSIEKKAEGNHTRVLLNVGKDNEAEIEDYVWKSTVPDIATVSPDGYVEILKEGEAHVECKIITRLENGDLLEFYKYIKL